MADSAQIPINGTYHAQPSYHESFNHAHTAVNSVSNFQPAQSSTPSNAPSNEQKNGIAKDEVGWYFVEQYYTNMSRSPDKLHLFYSRRSQLVFGTEAESVTVTVGQKAIQEKIKQLDFQDCKVRVLNVDSQASFDNILVSVIGEISNKQEPSRKFVQTFVLAEQPNGYYVLNDVFRYLVDDEEIAEDAAVEAPAEEQPEVEAPSQPEVEAAAVQAPVEEPAVEKVDEKLEEVATKVEEEPAPQTNGAEHPEATPEAAPGATEPAAADVETEVQKPEEPASPKPTPVPTAQKEVQPEAAPAAKAAIPKTWANIASKIGAAAPVVPAIPAASVKPAPTTPAVQKEVQPAAPAPAATAPVAESVPSQPSSNDGSGWQTAGHDHKKSQARSAEDQNVLGYIKNVTDKVDANLLRQTLSRFGKLKHFDVSRQKNCAFVEFSDAAAYNAAVAANPHQIGTEQVNVEERRTRGNAYGGISGRGGGAGRGRGDRAGSQGRGGFPRDGRGNFAPRGRGGNVNPKGRNQAQAA
ncbi:hypothetical protein BJX68DRAFT_241568 [Aspergillus pseudodeflectus]|uniref:NTF2 and RRM domain protein n=1 Tax=Aspergillus pseudodeflectus TaxID=176178 RepID=A0ABR4K0C3_9EURO